VYDAANGSTALKAFGKGRGKISTWSIAVEKEFAFRPGLWGALSRRQAATPGSPQDPGIEICSTRNNISGIPLPGYHFCACLYLSKVFNKRIHPMHWRNV